MLALRSGKAIRFEESKTRPMGRNASGVRGITLANAKDEVIGMVTIENPLEETVLVVSENGYGKRTFIDDPEDGEPVYRITNRGGKGVKTISITDKTGDLVAIKSVSDDDDLMIINKSGIAIRLEVTNLRTMGRATQGVKLINLKNNDSIAAVAKVMRDEDEEVIDIEASDSQSETENGTALDNSQDENNN
jgi:DNA gyrase subunit A